MIQEVNTAMAPDAVLAEAKRFFASRNPLYAAFLEKEGPAYAIKAMSVERLAMLAP